MLGYSGDPTRRAHFLGPRSLDGGNGMNRENNL